MPPARRWAVARALAEEPGRPLALRCDNGPEFTSRQFLAWCAERGIEVIHIEPGRPVQNAHVEPFGL
jgi:putative transposase